MKDKIKELKIIATKLRMDIIEMLAEAGSGHSGGSLSCADILACLYFSIMRHNPKDPKWRERDRFILSKGTCLSRSLRRPRRGRILPREEIFTLRKLNSILQGIQI
jgi:transketolase subunit A (EC 2.2.1.1)